MDPPVSLQYTRIMFANLNEFKERIKPHSERIKKILNTAFALSPNWKSEMQILEGIQQV